MTNERPMREVVEEPRAIDGRPSGLVAEADHVEGFRQAREARRTELVEDYVELIADLIDDGGEARQVDIAARLGVAPPTVAEWTKRLAADGWLGQRRYRSGLPPEAGRAHPAEGPRRHPPTD